MAKMEKERVINLLNSALDVLSEVMGREWLVKWAINEGLSDEEIDDWVWYDIEYIREVRREMESEEDAG
jgi:hypothetical protein